MNEQSLMRNQSQLLNQPQMLNYSQMAANPAQMVMNQPQMAMNQNQPHQLMNQPPQMMNQTQLGMNRSYGLWEYQQAGKTKSSMNPPKYQKIQNSVNQSFTASQSVPGRSSNWSGKKGMSNRKDGRRNPQQKHTANSAMKTVPSSGGGFIPPSLQELQSQNRFKTQNFYHRKKYNNNNNINRFAPYAPRNTTSFLIRAKKSGGITSLVSPCPVTPAVLATPKFSPSREVLGEMVKQEWGVDGYGSMKGLIRLRNESEMQDEDDDEDGGSSESDVEEHVEVERRLDHDLSRFEMIYPNCELGYNNLLENRVDDQDTHIAQLEEENFTLKERLFLMERELGDLRRRLQCLERQNQDDEEVLENGSENESENSRKSELRVGAEENNEECEESLKEEGNNGEEGDVSMQELVIESKKDVITDEDDDKSKNVDEGN